MDSSPHFSLAMVAATAVLSSAATAFLCLSGLPVPILPYWFSSSDEVKQNEIEEAGEEETEERKNAEGGNGCLRAENIHSDSGFASGFPALVGNTPMIKLESLSRATGCTILAKAEFLNPGGSSKDRVAKQIVQDAEERGQINEGGTIVEGTSGSTGISLSLMARARGYKCIICMPDDQAAEKIQLLRRFGADVRLVKPASIVNPNHYCKLAERLAAETPGAFFANQFENLSNFRAHVLHTGREIWKQTNGKVDAFVMGAGTGGTIGGVSRYLKQKRPSIQVFLVDPPGSSLYNKVRSGVCYTSEQAERTVKRHRYDTIVEGVGIDRMTANFSLAKVDDAFRVRDSESVAMARFLLSKEGLFVGSSSAMNCVGAVRAARKLGPGHTILTVLCDSGQRHLTKFWNEAYLAQWGIHVRQKAADGVSDHTGNVNGEATEQSKHIKTANERGGDAHAVGAMSFLGDEPSETHTNAELVLGKPEAESKENLNSQNKKKQAVGAKAQVVIDAFPADLSFLDSWEGQP